MGISKLTINIVWQSHHLQPHRVETFKLSRGRRFLEKPTTVVGLYLKPPEKAIVSCVDESAKSGAGPHSAWLTVETRPLRTSTRDYKRNGTTTPFAAWELPHGQGGRQCYKRPRHQESLKFLRQLDQEFPGALSLHPITDNYAPTYMRKSRRG